MYIQCMVTHMGCHIQYILLHTVDNVTFKELLYELKEVTDWWFFGKVVNISQAQLLTIQRDGMTTDKCRALTIEKWTKLEKITWSKVVSSVFKCGMTTLGWELAANHCKLVLN